MTFPLIFAIGIILFLIGVISPHLAGKIQRKTDEKASRLKRLSNWFWDPITWWAKKTIESTRKILVKITEWGKKIRRKISSRKGSKKP
jgi:hypothetical protein